MTPSSIVHGGQHDTKYVTFEMLLRAAFVAEEFRVLCLNQLVLVACLLAGCLEGAREVSSRQAITPARYDGGTLATNHNTAQGRGDIITLAHPEGSHMQIDKRIRRELNRAENSENGSKMRHFTTHSHTSNLQGRSRLTRTKRLRR